MDSGGFKKRFLLLNDNVCIGLFNSREGAAAVSNTTIILSHDGQFVYISQTGTKSRQHLTRFCPSRVVENVIELLRFRNSHVQTPYLCERFHGGADSLANATRFSDDLHSEWDNLDVQSVGELSSDTEASIIFDADNATSNYMANSSANKERRQQKKVEIKACRFNRQLKVTSESIYFPDELLSSGVGCLSGRGSLLSGRYPALSCSTTCYYPIHFAPAEYIKSLEIGTTECVGVIRCSTSICGDSKSANDTFRALEGEISLLQDLEMYPTVSNQIVLHEHIDGISYVLNGPGHQASSPSVDLNASDLHLEAWLPQESWEGEGEGAVLSLKGEYFSLFWIDKNTTEPGYCEIHVSLVNFKDEGADALRSDNGSQQSYVERMHSLKPLMLRLVNFRDYLETNRKGLSHIGLTGYEDESTLSIGLKTRVKTGGEPIALVTSEAKFVALTEIYDNDQASSSSSHRRITKIHAMFVDHTLIDFEVATGLVAVITSAGETLEFDLESCFRSSDHVSGDLLTAMYTSNERTNNGPPPSIVRHVRSIIAFYRWAKAPAEERTRIVDHGVEVARVAKASALQSHRHLLLHKMRQGKIEHKMAGNSTSILEASLNVTGRDSMLGLTPFSYTGLARALDSEEQLRKQRFDESIAPRTVYSVVVPDRAACVHPSFYQTELREVAKHALQQTAAFLADTASLEKRAHLNAMRS